ncbi:MAG: hypothetical protein H6719_31725 [Sandaracinaceae bacterium]|nr:hypothetical protein [Sandaracinaceae bacterium]
MTALAIPASASALDLMSPGGFLFDISDTSWGSLGNGTIDAYDTMYFLNVNGTRYDVRAAASTTSLGGRQVEMAEIAMGSLMVRRLIYVPTGGTGQNYARYLDLVRNPTAAPIMATVMINGSLGSDSSTTITGTSSGDTVLTVADTWFTTDDTTDGGGDPSLGHVFQGPGGSTTATTVTLAAATDTPTWSFTVMVPAGGTAGFLTFAVQEMNRALSIAESRRLVDLPPDAFNGLDTYAADIVNFPVGGAPIVRFTSPDEIDEGAETPVMIAVEDLEMDPSISWSWDTNDDGTFGEMPGATMYTIPAGSTDGEGTVRVGVEATDGTNTRRVYKTIIVHNVAPVITSSAPTMAHVRREYVYTPTIDEPAGAADALRYVLVSRPMGMEVDTATGTIRWTPSIDQRARTFDVNLRIDDGDGGEDEQVWRIDVADNAPPDSPVPVSPIDRIRVAEGEMVTLVAENATDDDGDTLVYFFRLSQTSRFEGPDVVGSGELDEDPSGMTQWTAPMPLARGLWYWEVWVDDGITESFHRYAQVVVGDVDMPEADAGVANDGSVGPGFDAGMGGGGGGGCAAAPAGSTAPAIWLVGLAGLVLWRRRRR